MKLLIIASPDGPTEPVPERFVRMRDRLATLGIDTALSPSLPREALEALVSRERPDLACSAPYRCAGDGEPVHATLERAGVPAVVSSQETLELALDKSALAEWRMVKREGAWNASRAEEAERRTRKPLDEARSIIAALETRVPVAWTPAGHHRMLKGSWFALP
jgi:hypothetical protein